MVSSSIYTCLFYIHFHITILFLKKFPITAGNKSNISLSQSYPEIIEAYALVLTRVLINYQKTLEFDIFDT